MGVDWDAIYGAEYISVADCWRSCGGYCCSNFLAKELSLPHGGKVVVPYLPGEFAFQQARGDIPAPCGATRQRYVLPDGQEWDVHFLQCGAQGRCDGLFHKPLVCRIYPYFPLVDLDGTIQGFDYCALIDLFHPGPEKHPCTIVREHGDAVQAGLRSALTVALRHPEIIFAFSLFRLLAQALRRSLPGTLDAPEGSDGRRNFLRAYQWQVYLRKPWTTPQFKADVAALYAAMTKRHGPLNLS